MTSMNRIVLFDQELKVLIGFKQVCKEDSAEDKLLSGILLWGEYISVQVVLQGYHQAAHFFMSLCNFMAL